MGMGPFYPTKHGIIGLIYPLAPTAG